MSIRPEAARLLTQISRLLAARNIRAYLVGGFLRDTLLERATADIDIGVDADALETARYIAASLSAKYVPLDEVNRVGRVIVPEGKWLLDFSTFKGKTIEEDLAQRDFTVDALAYPLDEATAYEINDDKIIDLYGGRADLDRRILRGLNTGIFKADAARLLRAVRIAAEAGFRIEANTEAMITEDRLRIRQVAGERTREELLRLLALPGAGNHCYQMDRLGLLTALIPELEAAKGVDQPQAHVWDVYEHSLQTVHALEFVLRESDWEYGNEETLAMIPWSERLEEYFNREISAGSTGKTILKLTALLHDIAKPQTKFIEDGHARFFGHQEQGAAIAGAILERMRFSNKEIQLVELIIKHHLRPTQMSNEGLPTNRAIYRFFRDTGEAGIGVLFLSLADHLAARGGTLDKEEFRQHAEITAYTLKKHFEETVVTAPPKIISGRDVMENLGLPAGPIIGEMLEILKEAQAAGEINDKSQAMAYLKKIYSEKYKNIHN